MVEKTVSMCDRCRDPGACCKAFHLNGIKVAWSAGVEDIQRILDAKDLPFIPIRREGTWKKGDDGELETGWLYSCPRLSPAGRCTIYENRPELCKKYTAGEDNMCFHVFSEGTKEPSVPLLPLEEVL